MRLDLRKVLDADDFLNLARLDETGAGRALVKLATAALNSAKERYETGDVQVNDNDPRKDFRYVLGQLDVLKTVLSWQGEASEWVDKSEGTR